MSHVFISYARSTAKEAQAVAAGLRGLGHEVWLDDEIPAHRAYTDVIEERLKAAKAVVVIWSAEAVKSQWVQSEADKARGDGKLVQLNLDGSKLPMPFDRIQCADLAGWRGEPDHAGWKKVLGSITDLAGDAKASPAVISPCPEVRYARSGDFDIAYICLGDGALDIVLTPGMFTHLEAGWEIGAAGLLALSAFARVITFDKRGQGMSDRMVGSPTLEERMDDIRAVMNAAGSERAVLFGVSEGGPMSLLFAAMSFVRANSQLANRRRLAAVG